MNSGKSRIFDPYGLLVSLLDKRKLKRNDRYVALSNFSIYYTWKNILKIFRNNKFKISAPTQNEELELSDGSYSISDIEDYFEYIFKKHKTVADNSSINIHINNIELLLK